jgi:hypothetical protein
VNIVCSIFYNKVVLNASGTGGAGACIFVQVLLGAAVMYAGVKTGS